MTLKTTIHSLTFALAASLSSFALAQGLNVGIGAQPEASVQAGTQGSATTDMATGAHGSSASSQGQTGKGTATDLKGTAAADADEKDAAAAAKADADTKVKTPAFGS